MLGALSGLGPYGIDYTNARVAYFFDEAPCCIVPIALSQRNDELAAQGQNGGNGFFYWEIKLIRVAGK